MFEELAEKSPAKRMGTVEEISSAVVYLLSPAAHFITGETIKVDGGMHLHGDAWDIPSHTKCSPYGSIPSKL